jgi:4-amino-4-deoxy-L-arabinose transferase-like glycosyltransferase
MGKWAIVTTTFPPLTEPTDSTPATAVTESASRPTKRDRIALAVLLVATAVTYLWNITINGMGNQFYAGAAWAGSKNWEALLFGSLDPHNFITVDKPPVSQWVMGLSGQLFGFSSASMLIPEALMGVAAVALVYAAVARVAGRPAGLLAGALLALTPVAALMFRFNNPDAAMVLLMTAGAYCTVRALGNAGAKWMAWAGVALGLAFLAKMLEGLMVMPALGLAYLIAAPSLLGRRLVHLGGALLAFLVASGWFVVVTLLWPASSRPYIAGSTDNNFMNLVLGYNGFARVLGRNHHGFGSDNNSVVGTSAGDQVMTNRSGHGSQAFSVFGNQSQGVTRLFSGEFGFEVGWLLPAALLAIVLVFIVRGRAPRTDPVRALTILFSGWIIVDGLVLSFMSGMIHPYYCLSLAPAVAGMFALGVAQMWVKRQTWLGRFGLAAMIVMTGIWSWILLGRNNDWLPALRWAIVGVTIAATLALLYLLIARPGQRWALVAALAIGLTAAAAGPAAYTIATIAQAHQGGGPTVGPADPGDKRGNFGWGQNQDNSELDWMLKATSTQWSAAIDRSSSAAALELSTNTAVMAIGGFSGSDPVPTLDQFIDDVHTHKISYYVLQNNHGHGPGRSHAHADIEAWVAHHFTPVTVGSATVYDLTKS